MSLDERDDSFIPWLVYMAIPLQFMVITFLVIKDIYPTYMQTFINSPLTGPVGFVFLLNVTFTYMSAGPELWTVNFIAAFMLMHVVVRYYITYPLGDNIIEEKHWNKILSGHIGTNISFFVLILCFRNWCGISFNWRIFVYFFSFSTALAMNDSMRSEQNVHMYARHIVPHCIMSANILYNKNVENMLFRMYKDAWSTYAEKHKLFYEKMDLILNASVALCIAYNFVEYNALTIISDLVLPFLVSLPVWSWDFNKGFRKGWNWRLTITLLFFCVALGLFFIHPEPNVTCKIDYDKTYQFDGYKFDVLDDEGKKQVRDVNLKVTFGPTFRDVNTVAVGLHVDLFNNHFDIDKRVILAYELLRTKEQTGCELQVEWRVNVSWIPHIPVLQTGKEWPFRWLNVFGTPTRLILLHELNRAEEIERLKQDIERLKQENTKNEHKLEAFRPCETNLGNCKTEEARLKPLETNVTTILQTINNQEQDASNPVTVENLAETYLALVQKVKDLEGQIFSKDLEVNNLEGQISTKDSEIESLTRERNKKQETLTDIGDVLSELEGGTTGTIKHQIVSLISRHEYCAGQLGFKQRMYEGCEKSSLLCEDHLGVLKNLTQKNNTIESLTKVKWVFDTLSEYESELDRCNEHKVTIGVGWGFTPNTLQNNTNTKTEQKKLAAGLRKQAQQANQNNKTNDMAEAVRLCKRECDVKNKDKPYLDPDKTSCFNRCDEAQLQQQNKSAEEAQLQQQQFDQATAEALRRCKEACNTKFKGRSSCLQKCDKTHGSKNTE